MIWLLVIAGVILLFVWISYNSLITAKVRISEAFSQIDVQLKRRADLIPNLVETVKGYVKHEKSVLEEVTKARTSLMSANGAKAKAQAKAEAEAKAEAPEFLKGAPLSEPISRATRAPVRVAGRRTRCLRC